ncbi:MAG: HAMP domain-containing histidine kinase [Prevotellaceae bacterium]|jgi:signal transduction histidine kinase|nr:HAMP domain-containing histidine kinase [Prevotellaceae bacterium]
MFSFKRNPNSSWIGWASLLSIAALLCFQVYWLHDSYTTTYAKFVADAGEALQEACKQEEQRIKTEMEENSPLSFTNRSVNIDTSASPLAIKATIIKKATVIKMQTDDYTINLHRLDSLYRQTLAKRGLYIDFSLALCDADKSKTTQSSRREGAAIIVESNYLGTSYSFSGTQQSFDININLHRVAATVPFTPFLIFRRMAGILIISVMLFLVIISCLMYQLKIIRNQKNTAKMKNDFIANFTHELKTPIAVAYAALDTLAYNRVTAAEAIGVGKSQLKRLSGLVEKILSLSLEEREQPVLYSEEILLNEWLPALTAPFQLRTDKKVEFQVTCSSDNIKIKIDKAHFANALNNIIDNALKYSGEQVQVMIACERTPHKLQISIRDNGFGIPGSEIQKIFDRFYRGKTTAGRIKGFGLGLNYAKTIVAHYGGTIEVESAVGKGSNFIITLPMED